MRESAVVSGGAGVRPWTLLVLVAALLAFGQAGAASGKAPRISIDTRDYSFGRVPNDRGVEHVFTVSNTGDAPLVVSRVQASCGCTAAMMETSVLKPGESGRLRVAFNPQRMNQRVSRSLAIYSNDPVEPRVTISVSADVVEPGEEKKPDREPAWTHRKKDKLVFTGGCAECHAPGSGTLSGARLYAAVCAACHGATGEGVVIGGEQVGPSLAPERMSVRTTAGVRRVIEAGTGHPWMPGFARAYKGPLTDKQVASLVKLITESFEKKR